jgi:hypothetical protein
MIGSKLDNRYRKHMKREHRNTLSLRTRTCGLNKMRFEVLTVVSIILVVFWGFGVVWFHRSIDDNDSEKHNASMFRAVVDFDPEGGDIIILRNVVIEL